MGDSLPIQDHLPTDLSGPLGSDSSSSSELRPLRLLYFLYFGGLGFIYPFLNLIFRRAGLTGTQIGWLATISSVCALLAAPVWGRWSDRVPDPRRLIQAGLLGAGASLIWLHFQQTFVWIAAAVGVLALAGAGIEPLANNLVLRITSRGNEGFGGVRVYGSLGFALIVLLGGWLFGVLGRVVAFFGAAATYAAGALAVGLIRPRASRSLAAGAGAGETRQAIREIGGNRAMLALAICLTVVWMTGQGRQQFEPIYLDQLGAGEWLIGLAYMIPAVIELPAMLWADRQVKRWGPAPVLGVSLLVSAGAEVLVLMRPSVVAVMLLRAIGGISFSLFTVSLVTMLDQRAPARHKALVMALFLVTLNEACIVVGSPAVGWLFDALGAYWLYGLALMGNLVGWFILRWAGEVDRRGHQMPGNSL
jgi:PPP family 3-phenylpropionic acid transporter